jgi:hypothetical protein
LIQSSVHFRNCYGYSNDNGSYHYSGGGGLCRADDLAESEIRVEKFIVRGGLRLRFKENYKLKIAKDEKSLCNFDFGFKPPAFIIPKSVF